MEEPSTEQTENPLPTTKSPVNLEIEQVRFCNIIQLR